MAEPQSSATRQIGDASDTYWKPVISLAGLLGLRMLGLFMVLPVLALHVGGMPGATPLAAGLALGIYGLTQGLLQLPFGHLSDRLGRRPVIFMGLAIFAVGSAVAAFATSPYVLVLGRALQGAGAISAATMALVSDIVPLARRTRAMAIIGMSIGAAFMLAFAAGPVLAAWFGVPGLFWLTAAFALAGMGLLATVPESGAPVASTQPARLRAVLPTVWRQAAGVFLLHAMMTATFLAVPLMLTNDFALVQASHAWIYLPVMAASLLLLAPLVLMHEKRSARFAMHAAAVALLLGQAGLLAADALPVLCLGLWLFFGGFNYMEARLPASVSESVGADARGAGMGVYATAQFLGAFAGGLVGGTLASHWGIPGVLAGNVSLAAAWWLMLFLTGALPGSGKEEVNIE